MAVSPRAFILAFGPIGIVAGSYWLTMPEAARSAATVPEARYAIAIPATDSSPLRAACEKRAAELQSRMTPDCRMIVRSPFVIGGDLSEAELDRYYVEMMLPTARALSTCYFDAEPDAPIAVLIFSSEGRYQEHARGFDGQSRARYSGYYQRNDRRLVINIGTGDGTLAHELTHALAHFDFPSMPEWLDEGLASLHEESEFSDDGLQISGLPNWRFNYLTLALEQNRLRTIDQLITGASVRPGEEAIDYAHARYFCMYLQERGLLGPYYRKLRESGGRDPNGLATLQALLHTASLAQVDDDFRAWLRKLHPAQTAWHYDRIVPR